MPLHFGAVFRGFCTGKAYSLLNQMLLGRPGEYLTFNECRKAGGYVRKGEKAVKLILGLAV